MSLHDFLKIARQRWIVIVLSVLVAAGVMFAVTPANYDTTPQIGSYRATATLLVEGPTSLGRVELFIKEGEVPKRAAARLGDPRDPAVLAASLDVESNPAAQSVAIKTTATDGASAAAVANAFAEEAVAFFDENPAGIQGTKLRMFQVATPIPNPGTSGFVIPPDRNIRTALAAALGLLFGLALALLLDRLDSRLRTRDEVAEALRLPIIGDVPRLKRAEQTPGTILTVSKPLSVYADGYRAVRTAIMHAPQPTEDAGAGPRRVAEEGGTLVKTSARLVLISSAHPGEGKTTSAVNLAASFAETGQQVLALDVDLRNPDMHVKFDVPQGAGVSDYLTDPSGTSLRALVRPTSVPGVEVITAGTRLDSPAALTSRIEPLIQEARGLADVVIIDTAPLLAASDVFDILPLADAIVLIVRSGRLTSNAAHRAAELLRRFRVPVLGTILIGAPVRKADYGYTYGYGEERRNQRLMDDEAPAAPLEIEANPPSGDDEPSPNRAR